MPVDLREKARSIGLERLPDEYLEQMARAIASMDRHLRRLPADLPVSLEPAHIFRVARGPV